ncbi:MAG: carbohydrate ABC transporter permease [Anaerolineaceae bacterium]|nr:carbohydrate ABC transporter permease [Anaerolineaceae bacterium]
MQVSRVSLGDVVRHLLVLVVLVIFLFPIYWMIATSFKPAEAILTRPPTWVFTPTLDNYIYAFEKADFGRYIGNTLYIAGVSTLLVVAFGALASYSFARYNPGDGHIMFFILTTRMMPGIAVIIPFFLIFREIGNSAIGKALFIGLDRPFSLVIVYTVLNLPFAIWLMHSFFQDIPVELENSARLDGYTRFQVFRKVVLPLAAPGIAVTAIFSLMFAWNEFLFAFILTRDVARTITVGVSGFISQQGILWGPLTAAAVVCVVPMLLFALALQRYMVRGLTFGAVRG